MSADDETPDEEVEVLPPVHVEEEVAKPITPEPFPLADPGEYYNGLWNDLPNYKCPYCMYATLSGDYAVEMHILAKVEQGHPRHMSALELK